LPVSGGSTNLGVIGNPDLKPEETTSGELGLQQQLTDDISIDITGYFRDIRNLAGTLNELEYVFGGSAVYSKYVNTDFGFVRGIVLSIDKRFSQGISATLDYTFQIAKGDASDPNAAFNLRTGGVLPETQLIPLDWDQRHTLNATLNYSNNNDWGASFVFQFGSGTPYTPQQVAVAGQLAYNSETKPPTYNLDARIYKNFQVGATTLTLFMRIDNLLDTKNAYTVYNDTGEPNFSLVEQRLIEINPPQRVSTVQDWYTRAYYYSAPRRVQFGITYSF
jgi:outer membrane receptor for ferrienterochelin and colicin